MQSTQHYITVTIEEEQLFTKDVTDLSDKEKNLLYESYKLILKECKILGYINKFILEYTYEGF